jgi:sugar O-acyltransferase (sialic acid O-acetyltransferase NeuD family)
VREVVLFGLGKIAEVVHYYLTNDGDARVVAFTCDREFVDRDDFLGLPVVPFDEVEDAYPPDRYELFVALAYQQMNRLRASRLAQARSKGYRTPSFIHPQSGAPLDLELGDNCFIMNNVCIQPRVTLGDNVFVWSGALIGHHSTIGDHCWLTSNTSIAGSVTVGRNCFFGLNATVANDLSVGNHCFLGANTLVTKDLPDEKVVVEKASDVLRVTPQQFLRISAFR